jgi:Ca2+-transporting ATPase
VINTEMTWRILVQAVVDTIVVLAALRIGLSQYPGQVHHAQTMAFATLAISELLRAYTARSEHFAIWKIGVFSNKAMQYAVAASLIILLAIIYVPILDPIFDTVPLSLNDWLILTPLILIPAVVSEMTKYIAKRMAYRSSALHMA